jgi:uncharacterized protein
MELTLFLDHQCNLRCTYCYNGDKFTRRMSVETLRKAIDLGLGSHPDHLDVSFFGGEPLIHPDLVREAIEYAERAAAAVRPRPPTVRFIMNTNGTLLDDEAIALMSPPRAFVAFVSLDGPREVHDRHRVHAGGRGSFDDVMAGIGRLRAASIPFQILAVVGTSTAASLGETARVAVPTGATKTILAPNFRDEWTDESIGVLRAGLRDVGDAWMELFRAGRAVPIEPLHGKILTHLKGGIPCPSRCLLGGTELTVTPTGRVYPCAQMVGEDRGDGLVIGHVDTGLDRAALATMQAAKDRVEQTCAPCALRDRCQSHCGCRHVALTGKLGEITAALCEVEAAFIDEADRVAETLYADRCEAFVDYYYRKQWVGARGGALTQLRRARDS